MLIFVHNNFNFCNKSIVFSFSEMSPIFYSFNSCSYRSFPLVISEIILLRFAYFSFFCLYLYLYSYLCLYFYFYYLSFFEFYSSAILCSCYCYFEDFYYSFCGFFVLISGLSIFNAGSELYDYFMTIKLLSSLLFFEIGGFGWTAFGDFYFYSAFRNLGS